MGIWNRGSAVDRQARDRAAEVVTSLLDRAIPWDAATTALGTYTGPDRGVQVIHAELRSVASDPPMDGTDDPDLQAVLHRTRWFLRSDQPYRWHDRGPLEIIGAYLGGAALAWMLVAAAGAIWGFGHEAVIAGALLAMLLMYVMSFAMAIALLRRLWWRYTARRDGANYAVWPFFNDADFRAAREAGADVAP